MTFATRISPMILSLTAAFALSACGSGEETAAGDTPPKMDHAQMDHSKMDHSKMGSGNMGDIAAGNTGHTTGTIISISESGTEATINHAEIAGIGMGAMTMGFGITSDVDLSAYSAGDSVSFMVKKGRDNGYRITAICNTATDGVDCLDAKMDHSGH